MLIPPRDHTPYTYNTKIYIQREVHTRAVSTNGFGKAGGGIVLLIPPRGSPILSPVPLCVSYMLLLHRVNTKNEAAFALYIKILYVNRIIKMGAENQTLFQQKAFLQLKPEASLTSDFHPV